MSLSRPEPAIDAPDVAPRDADFAALMARFAPFEPVPHLAVGVSGGADSLALALLAQDWARTRGGKITALTVDHGLRPDSAAEAAQVGAWLRGHAIAHAILPWSGPKPTSGIQARARAARRGLLVEWCRRTGVLHLLLAHQRDDQAETVLLRRQHDSGPDGLAAMAAIVELPDLRILRPLLGLPHVALTAFLTARGQVWAEDPSNRNPAFTRIQVRQTLDETRAAALAESAAQAGRARAAHEREVARHLAACVTIHPQGWASVDGAGVRGLDALLSQAVLGTRAAHDRRRRLHAAWGQSRAAAAPDLRGHARGRAHTGRLPSRAMAGATPGRARGRIVP